MPQTIRKGYKALVAEAEAEVASVSAAQAQEMLAAGEAVLVDVRDIRELAREGRIPGALHAPRGMLEFWIDPASPYHKPAFAEDKTYVFACAAGWRSLLAAQTAQAMGLAPVKNMDGGFGGWREAGLPIDPPKPRDPKT